MKLILGMLIILASTVGAFYISIWWGIVKPIMTIIDAVDTDTLTSSLVGWEVCKFFLREILAAIVGWVGFAIGILILESHD